MVKYEMGGEEEFKTCKKRVSRFINLLSNSPNLLHLRHIHAHLLLTSLLHTSILLSSKLITMYSKHHRLLPDSLSVFHQIPNKDSHSWSIIIKEFSHSNSPHISLHLFSQMLTTPTPPDPFILAPLLRSCAASASSFSGRSTHCLSLKLGLHPNLFVSSSLVFFYITLGEVCTARKVFDEMPERDTVLWTAMMAGYVQKRDTSSGLALFRDMVGAGVEVDEAVTVMLLQICSQIGWLKEGRGVHCRCVRRCLLMSVCLGNALVDFYVKCSSLGYARSVFDEMPERDVISWSTVITGYGLSGCVDGALGLFDMMVGSGVRPNGVTFLGVLSACAHGGLAIRCGYYFEEMKRHGVVPELNHYTCLVDCLGKAGRLEEAERVVEEMPMEDHGSALGALLGACRLYGNVEVGERVARRLVGMEPSRCGYHVLLGHIYADVGRFDDAERVWSYIKWGRVPKYCGSSLVES